MTEKIPDPFDQAAGGSAVVPVKLVQEHIEEAKLDEALMIRSKVAELDQCANIFSTMPQEEMRDLAAKPPERCVSLVQDLRCGKGDWEGFATLYDGTLEEFGLYARLRSIKSLTMDEIKASEEAKLGLVNQEKPKVIQIGITNGKPVRVTNLSYGGGLQFGGYTSATQLQAMLRILSSSNQEPVDAPESKRYDTNLKDGFTYSAPSNVICLEGSSHSAAGDHEDPLEKFYAECSSDFCQKDGKPESNTSNYFCNSSDGSGEVQFDVQTPTGRYKISDRPNKVCTGTSDFGNQS